MEGQNVKSIYQTWNILTGNLMTLLKPSKEINFPKLEPKQ